MAWQPQGISAQLLDNAAFSLSDLEDTDYPPCPARVGIKARKGWVRGSPDQEPFGNLLTALIKEVVVALAQGRSSDPDGGLARAARTYRACQPLVREFLDIAALNYLEFLEAREAKVGRLTYLDYFHRRDIAPSVSLKLWSPVYETERGTKEIHRLRYGSARSDSHTWATGAAWIAGRGAAVTVIEFGLTSGSACVLHDASAPDVIQSLLNASVVPTLRTLFSETHHVPGSHCVSCDAVSVCPALIPLDLLGGQPDATPWVRSLSESDLARYRVCPAKSLAKSLHLPSEQDFTEAIARGARVHGWIADRHASGTPCADYLLIEGTGFEEDDPYITAHAALCDRHDSQIISSEVTLVGWDAGLADVVFMKPDEILVRNGSLFLREIKTTTNAGALDAAAAWQQYADVSTWWLTVLGGGLATYFGFERAVVELEVLTPAGGAIHQLSSDEEEAMFRVAGWRLDTPALWTSDRAFIATPGPQCSSCEVVRWCRVGQAQA
jgi:hypothetical protein